MTGPRLLAECARVPTRWPTILLALLATTAFAWSVQGGRWWVIDIAELGPFGARVCNDSGCTSGELASFGGGPQWMRFGMATWGAGLIAGFVLLVMAARVAARNVPRLAARTVVVSLATAAIVGGLFVAKFPDDRLPPADLARGALLYAIAIVLGALAAVSVLRTKP